MENDINKPINISQGLSGDNYYGIVNDEKINKIEILLDNGKVLTETEFYDNMFIFLDSRPNDKFPYLVNVKGYDSETR